MRFATRYLIDRGIRGRIKIEGKARKGKRIDWIFDNPTVSAAPGQDVALRVLSFDIETDPKAEYVLSIGLYGYGRHPKASSDPWAEVLLLTPEGRTCPESATPAKTEGELIEMFCERVRTIDPDVIIGWNVADFDFSVLQRRAQALRVRFELGRGPGATRIRRSSGQVRMATQVQIPGRVVLDGPTLLRSSFIRMERMGLDAVAKQVLGEGKSLGGPGKASTILRWFREERDKLVEYNLRDCRLALEILERLEVIELTLERSLLTGMPLDRVSASVASFDFLYLSELHKRKICAPSVSDPASPDRENFAPMAGGHLLKPKPGLWDNVLLLDFKSLYPSIMRTFQIDPLGHAHSVAVKPRSWRPTAPTSLVNKHPHRHSRPPLSGQRARQTNRNKHASQAIKILMNSFYGVLGTTSCRFFDPKLANAITSFGKALLLWSRDRLQERGYQVSLR